MAQSDAIEVRLTESELLIGAMVGAQRQVENLMKGRRHAHGGSAERGWQYHLEGALGEQVVAKWRNVYWNGALGDLDADDVGHLQVRTTVRSNGCLLIHRSDPDDRPFLLVTGEGPVFHLRGWLWGRECKREEWWRTDTGRPAFFVPQSALRPMRRRGETVPEAA